MDQSREPDEQLMLQVALGRRDCLSVLLRRYATPLLTFIRRMHGDRLRSEELFQDVFLAVWTHRHRYEYPRPFKSWLFGIAVRKCQTEFDRRPQPDVPGVVAPVSTASSPVEAAIATETAALVQTALLRLPPQQRAVVALRVWNGCSYSEIAGMVGASESTVRSHMCHGLATLRKYLEPRMR
jgi:RNA polymerase sigma-70 factor (ECF subfamily)